MTTTTTTPLISSAVAAARFGVDRATLNRWAAEGKVPTAIKLEGPRGARLFDSATVDKLVAHYTEHGELPAPDPEPTA